MTLDEGRVGWSGRVLSRRSVIQRAILAGLSLPVVGGLMAACGADDEESPTATAGGATGEATPTEAMAEGTATEAVVEPTATVSAGITPTASDGTTSENPRWMGLPVVPAAHEGGTMVFTYDTTISTGTNPLVDSFEYGNGWFVYETLTRVSQTTGEPIGLLADSWEISDDLLTYTFTTREGVAWHDGEPFSAADVKFTLDAGLSGELNYDYFSILDDAIDSYEQPDERTIVFNLSSANAQFALSPLPEIYIVAAHVFNGVEYADIATHPATTGEDMSVVVGTGPFRFQEVVENDHSTVVRYDDYWDGRAYLDEVVNVVGDQTTSAQRLRIGEIDYTTEIPGAQVAELSQDPNLTAVEYQALGTRWVAFNLDAEKFPIGSDVNVRRALLHAINRDEMLEAVKFGLGAVSDSFLRPASWLYDESAIEVQYPFDQDLANRLLDEAGWVIGDDGVREKDGEWLAFTLMTLNFDEEFIDFSTIVQEFWRQVGCEVTLDPVEWTVFSDIMITNHDHQCVGYRYWWDPTMDMTFAFACNQYPEGSNWMAYCNEEADRLMSEARAETDPEARTALLHELDNVLLADLPVLPLYAPGIAAFMTKRLHNAFPSTVSTFPIPQVLWMEEE
jgi:peptide/nickel transport system substrate-binding protein